MNKETLLQLKAEKLKRLKMLQYQQDPMLWLEERLGEDRTSFQWSLLEGYENHSWDGDKDPIYSAWMSLANKEWSSIEAATGTSKTYGLARIVLWFLDCFPDSLTITSAPKQDQLKLNLWAEIGKLYKKFKKFRPESKMTSLKLSLTSIDEDDDDPYSGWQAIGFVAGVGAEEQSATKAQGFHRANMLIVCEECPGMSNAVLTAFKNTCTGENNVILAVGNPDSQLDPLHMFGELLNVNNVRISAYDYPNVVLDKEMYPGAVTRASIERRKIDYGENSGLYLSRVRGISPKQGADSLIRMEWFEQCIDNVFEPEIYYYNAVGVDVANSETGDKGAVCYGIGAVCMDIREFICPSASAIAYNLLYPQEKIYEIEQDLAATRQRLGAKPLESNVMPYYDIPRLSDFDIQEECIGVDNVGVGVSTLNALLEAGWDATGLSGGQWEEAIPEDEEGKPMYKFISLRAQMYWKCREDLRLGTIGISSDIPKETLLQLKKELVSPKFKVKDNAIYVEKKEEIIKRIGGSPNTADAFVYWNWMRQGYKVRGGELPFIAGS